MGPAEWLRRSRARVRRVAKALRRLPSFLENTDAGAALQAATALADARRATGVVRTGPRLCIGEELASGAFREICERLREPPRFHRKLWEYYFIISELEQARALAPGARGLGFGVGTEPLASYFASRGAHIVATDLASDDVRSQVWHATKQHAAGALAALNARGLCPPDRFVALVSYENVDMTKIPAHLTGFDFIWSSCSLEHVGSIEASLDFVVKAMRCLKPGGVAVHTTEFNLSSDVETIERGVTVLLRRRDVEELGRRLAEGGNAMVAPDYDRGHLAVDRYVDVAPYLDEPHLRLILDRFATTSIGMTILRSGAA